MKFYRDRNGNIYMFSDDGREDNLIMPDMVRLSDREVRKLLDNDKQVPPTQARSKKNKPQ